MNAFKRIAILIVAGVIAVILLAGFYKLFYPNYYPAMKAFARLYSIWVVFGAVGIGGFWGLTESLPGFTRRCVRVTLVAIFLAAFPMNGSILVPLFLMMLFLFMSGYGLGPNPEPEIICFTLTWAIV